MYERRSLAKRLLIAVTALGGIMMASVFSARIAVESLFRGIATQRATGLSAVAWDPESMWSSYAPMPPMALQKAAPIHGSLTAPTFVLALPLSIVLSPRSIKSSLFIMAIWKI